MSQHIMDRFKSRFEGSPVERARWQVVIEFIIRFGVMADWKFAVIVGAGGKLVIDDLPRTFLAPHMAAGEGLAEIWLETVEAMIARLQNEKAKEANKAKEGRMEKPRRVKRTRQTKEQKELLLLTQLLGEAKDGLTLQELADAMEVSIVHARHLVVRCDECWVNEGVVYPLVDVQMIHDRVDRLGFWNVAEAATTLCCTNKELEHALAMDGRLWVDSNEDIFLLIDP